MCDLFKSRFEKKYGDKKQFGAQTRFFFFFFFLIGKMYALKSGGGSRIFSMVGANFQKKIFKKFRRFFLSKKESSNIKKAK